MKKCVPAFAVRFAGCRLAMTDALVREAVSRGADVYTTQLRQPARRRVGNRLASSRVIAGVREWGYGL